MSRVLIYLYIQKYLLGDFNIYIFYDTPSTLLLLILRI